MAGKVRIGRATERGLKGREETEVYVGRPSIFGNPFRGEQYGKEEAVARYEELLQAELKVGASPLARAVEGLRARLRGGESLLLMCWCEDSPCHAEVLAAALEDGQEASNSSSSSQSSS